ncbi:MAG TPA: hypothetical protein VFA76_03485 [Terriglobales bacterium]|nr:hypothetical protein [Terriglobales bacterium]
MTESKARFANKMALVVHPDLEVLMSYQGTLAKNGISTVVARDLPTALLAMTQHYFEIAIVSSRISEQGDGWTLAGVLRRAFTSAFVAVLAPETNVPNLTSAINSGVAQLYRNDSPVPDVVASVLTAAAVPQDR